MSFVLENPKNQTIPDCENRLGHYQKIVIALGETLRLMSEIDDVINHHGGWPGAFFQKS